MLSSQPARLFLRTITVCLVVLYILTPAVHGKSLSTSFESSQAAASPQTESPEGQPAISISSLAAKATELSRSLINMQEELGNLATTAPIADNLLENAESRNRFIETIEIARVDPHENFLQLIKLQRDIRETERKAGLTEKSILNSIAKIDTWTDYWGKQKSDAVDWRQKLGQSG